MAHGELLRATKRGSGAATRLYHELIVNDQDLPPRQRFTAAHELGHFYLRTHDRGDQQTFDWVDYRDDLSTTGTDPVEVFCNSFAATLLMPEPWVRWEAGRCNSINALASRFEVSQEAMRYRLANIGLRFRPS